MDKNKWNFIIDAIMFVAMAAIAGLGFLMKYVLVNSKERVAIYGRPVDLNFLGLGRHEWGAVHLYLSFALLALLVLHIVLHWKLIVALYRRYVPSPRLRLGITIAFAVLFALLFVGPLFVKPNVIEAKQGSQEEHGRGENSVESGALAAAPLFLFEDA
jgi:hypothetical protein